MKVWYKTTVSESSLLEGDRFDCSVMQTQFCCKEMEEAWRDFVCFDDGWSGTARISIRNHRYDDYDHLPISFCPWCKEPCEAIESARVRQIPKKVKREVETTVYDYVELPVEQPKNEVDEEDAE